jgi:23S rRNA (uracil1939-C5)-methyltransferase
LTLILNGKQLKDSRTEYAFCLYIQELFPEIVTVLINQNTTNGNAVLGKNWRTLCGDGYIYDELCSKKFRVYPASFWQVNNTQAQVLYNKAKEYADLKQGERLLDLYCGTGSVGICIAQKGTKLTGVEVVEQAVKDADFNAKLNNLDAEFICLETENALDDPRLKGLKPDVITVDPPRKGCAGAVEKIASLGAGKIVYISCDPATLARDLGILTGRLIENEKGELLKNPAYENVADNETLAGYYAIERIQPYDMFPQTKHVETLITLCRK